MKKKAKNWMPKPRQRIDPGLAAALDIANYQMRVRKEAIRQMTVNQEVAKVTERHRNDVEDEFTDWMYGAFALALHRKYGFGAKRIAGCFDYLQEIKNQFIADGIDHETIWDLVRDEIGLDITVEG